MQILFIAGFAAISTDVDAGHNFYRDTLGLPLEVVNDAYIAVDGFDGAKHLGIWPVAKAAQSCFGTDQWPDDVPIPQGSIEFEVEDVEAAASELVEAGHSLIHEPRTEPWGQTIARLLGPEGLLIGICHTPDLH